MHVQPETLCSIVDHVPTRYDSIIALVFGKRIGEKRRGGFRKLVVIRGAIGGNPLIRTASFQSSFNCQSEDSSAWAASVPLTTQQQCV